MALHNLIISSYDTEHIKEVSGVYSTRNLGDFTNSDLSAWVPLTLSTNKSVWNFGRNYFTNTGFQPKVGDGPADGSGKLNLVTTNVANAGWYSFFREIRCGEKLFFVGSETENNIAGKYLDFDFEFDTIAQAHRIGTINPHYFDNSAAVPASLSLFNTQYDLRGWEESGTSRSSSNSGSSLNASTHYWVRQAFVSNGYSLKFYGSKADRTNDASVIRTCTLSSVVSMRVQAIGAFVRYNSSGSILSIYNFGGDLCDWFGKEKEIVFDEINFGSSTSTLYMFSATATTSGDVSFQYRTQTTPSVWSDYSEPYTLEQLQALKQITGIYKAQFKAVVNPYSGSASASFTSFSVNSGDALTDYPATSGVLSTVTYELGQSTGDYVATDAADVKAGVNFGVGEIGTYSEGGASGCGMGSQAVILTFRTETGKDSVLNPIFTVTTSTAYGKWEDKSGGLVFSLGSATDKRIDALFITSNDLVKTANKFTYASKDYERTFIDRITDFNGRLSHYEVSLTEIT